MRRIDRDPPDFPFCRRLGGDAVIAANGLAAAFPDAYPVADGHALVVPRRHEGDYFALRPEERAAVWTLVDEVRALLQRRHGPDAFNVGVNAGAAAGQTVAHAHVHLIPRYEGDVDDPRGGVRHVIPSRAAWWEEAEDGPAP